VLRRFFRGPAVLSSAGPASGFTFRRGGEPRSGTSRNGQVISTVLASGLLTFFEVDITFSSVIARLRQSRPRIAMITFSALVSAARPKVS